MCHQEKCRNCGKPTWDGCGMHVWLALMDTKYEDRCPNWQKGYFNPCEPGQKPTIMNSSKFLPSFFGSVINVDNSGADNNQAK
mmetsp:Transcript_29476/g.61618  ORF Transcript_29476/g.61618 Transcript_29476/m.61618 type:complete len:83 (+) Transcript_29476:142-390(+)